MTTETNGTEKKKLSKTEKLAHRATNIAESIARLVAKIKSTNPEGDAARAALASAATAITNAVTNLNMIPASPTRSKRTRVAAGDKVAIKPTNRTDYEDLLTADEMNGKLVVALVTKKFVRCTTDEGASVTIPRAHIAA